MVFLCRIDPAVNRPQMRRAARFCDRRGGNRKLPVDRPENDRVNRKPLKSPSLAPLAELVDALDSKSSSQKECWFDPGMGHQKPLGYSNTCCVFNELILHLLQRTATARHGRRDRLPLVDPQKSHLLPPRSGARAKLTASTRAAPQRLS